MMTNANPVVVTGIGIVSAAGRAADATVDALRYGRSGLGPLARFHSPRCGRFPVAEVAKSDAAPRAYHIARDALQQALVAADLDPTEGFVTGLALGTCTGGMPETEDALATALGQQRLTDAGIELDETVRSAHECGATAPALAEQFGLRGPVTTLSSLCSSSAHAIATAADLLATGAADVMIAGGVDALCRFTLNGFASLGELSADGCRPFDVERDGTSLGEGAAFLVLELADRARMRGDVMAILSGYGSSHDAYHPLDPHPDGIGAAAAMNGALRMAGRSPAEVDYVNAHGLGTVEGDRAECRALRRVFGNHMPAVSSTKRVFGHTLGAAAAIDAVTAILALDRGFAPGSAGLGEVDPECRVEPLRATTDHEIRFVLSNSLAFGGDNAALCFAHPEALA